MKSLLVCTLLMFPVVAAAQTADSPPVAPPPTAEQAPADAELAPAVKTPVERPRPVVKPAPKPRPAVEAKKPEVPAKPAPVVTAKPPAELENLPTPAPAASTGGTAPAATSLGCWGLAFAMLIVGFAAGFFWRHQMSRRKLGGMSVRIGTWRGIP